MNADKAEARLTTRARQVVKKSRGGGADAGGDRWAGVWACVCLYGSIHPWDPRLLSSPLLSSLQITDSQKVHTLSSLSYCSADLSRRRERERERES